MLPKAAHRLDFIPQIEAELDDFILDIAGQTALRLGRAAQRQQSLGNDPCRAANPLVNLRRAGQNRRMKILLTVLALTSAIASAEPVTDTAAFAKIKNLAGSWRATKPMPGMGKMRVNYRVIAGGSAVQETAFPGWKNEMVSLFHLDGRGHLVMTHYCALGNQPHFALDTGKSTDAQLAFKLDGGSGITRKSTHMGSFQMHFTSPDTMENSGESFKDGKSAGTCSSTLQRVK